MQLGYHLQGESGRSRARNLLGATNMAWIHRYGRQSPTQRRTSAHKVGWQTVVENDADIDTGANTRCNLVRHPLQVVDDLDHERLRRSEEAWSRSVATCVAHIVVRRSVQMSRTLLQPGVSLLELRSRAEDCLESLWERARQEGKTLHFECETGCVSGPCGD